VRQGGGQTPANAKRANRRPQPQQALAAAWLACHLPLAQLTTCHLLATCPRALATWGSKNSWRRERPKARRKPDPGPPGAGRLLPYHAHANTAGLRARLQWGSVSAWSSTAATAGGRALLEVTGLQSRPTTDGPAEARPPQMHTYVQTVQSPTCLQVQPSLLKAPTS
jgi:hypothetical protein